MDLRLEDFMAVIDSLRHEQSDRAAAVLGVATLDTLLERLLRAWVLPGSPERIFESSGPLATLASKIDIACSFGMIASEDRRELHLLRKIRNDFAHAVDHTLTFDSPAVADRIVELRAPAVFQKLDPTTEYESRSDLFYASVAVMALLLSEFRGPDQAPPFIQEPGGGTRVNWYPWS